MKQKFEIKLRLRPDNKVRLSIINDIIKEYSRKGYRLTLRQLYYQLVSRKVIPNKAAEYQKLSVLLGKGRMSGIVDWDAIEDRIRVPRVPYWYNDPEEGISELARDYRVDRMRNQNVYVEVWVEKDALSGVLYPTTSRYGIRLMVNRGYSSITAMYKAYNRVDGEIGRKNIYIIYMGDHDPSGIDMVRDIRNRILEFLGGEIYNSNDELDSEILENFMETTRYRELVDEFGHDDDFLFEFKKKRYIHVGKLYFYDKLNIRHIALTQDQIGQYDLPPDPAKVTDPRANDYISKFGHDSWELDALEPDVLTSVLEQEIESIIDLDKYDIVLEEEKKDIEKLKTIEL